MIFIPRKKIITSRFRQRGNIVSQILPPPPPCADASLYTLTDFVNPEGQFIGGGVRTGMWWRPDGSKCFIARTFNSLRSYNVSVPFSIIPANWSTSAAVVASSVGRVQMTPDGSRLLSTSGPFITHTDMSSAFDITTLGTAVLKFMGLTVQDVYWEPLNGLRLWTNTSPGTLGEFSAATPFDVSSVNITPIKTFDMTVDAVNVSQFIFSRAGDCLYSVRLNPFPIVSWRLSTPLDIATAGNFSSGLTLNVELSNPIGPYFTPGSQDLIYCGSIKSGAAQQQFKVFSPP